MCLTSDNIHIFIYIVQLNKRNIIIILYVSSLEKILYWKCMLSMNEYFCANTGSTFLLFWLLGMSQKTFLLFFLVPGCSSHSRYTEHEEESVVPNLYVCFCENTEYITRSFRRWQRCTKKHPNHESNYNTIIWPSVRSLAY